MNPALPVVPSTDPKIAELQLQDALDRLIRSGEDEETPTYWPYLQQLIRHAWSAVLNVPPDGQGPSETLVELRDQLHRLIAGIGKKTSLDFDPRGEAATALFCAVRFLETGIRALASRASKERTLNDSELRVMRVLVDASTYLQRKDVYQQLGASLTAPRVGQLLSDLFHDGYLLRYQAPAQGGLTSFYALAPAGRAILELNWPNDASATPNSPSVYDRATLGRAFEENQGVVEWPAA
jgi:hypothetical protein